MVSFSQVRELADEGIRAPMISSPFHALARSNNRGGSPVSRGRLQWRLLLLVSLLLAVHAADNRLFGQSNPNEVSILKQLVEEQNRKIEEQNKRIEALSEKVRLLEQRDQQKPGLPAPVQLPAIVIDTNGVPIPTVSQSGSLEEKVRALESKQLAADEATAEKARHAPFLSVGADGFALSSADTNFVLRLRGILQVDSRTFLDDNPLSTGNDGFLIRRARPIIEGTLFRDFDFQLMPDFAGSSPQLFDAWLNYRYRPELQLRAGKLRGPVGLENLLLDSLLLFNERSLVNDLVPSRNLGVQLWGDIAGGALSYAAGIFNGDGDSRLSSNNDFGDDKVFAGRIFLKPFQTSNLTPLRGIGFGLGGSYSQVSSNVAALPAPTGGTLPGYFTAGQQQFFAYNPVNGPVVADGVHWRLSPQATYTNGPFGLLSEYAISHQGVLNSATLLKADLEHKAWQISAMWVLTGEPASFTGITPKSRFDPFNGGWGAWQLFGRFGQLDIDPVSFQGFSNPATSARSAASWSLGLNWWLNRNVRVLTSFSQTRFKGGGQVNPLDPTANVPPATVSAQDENLIFTRLQLAF
jgi:phosphate-selective porin OprO and OprP